jgi:hypothetical protein
MPGVLAVYPRRHFPKKSEQRHSKVYLTAPTRMAYNEFIGLVKRSTMDCGYGHSTLNPAALRALLPLSGPVSFPLSPFVLHLDPLASSDDHSDAAPTIIRPGGLAKPGHKEVGIHS